MRGSTVDGEFTTVDEIADLALFLASSRTNALSGQAFGVSHGAHMH
jgi:3-hydroxybutyrate dehydrogenase